MKPSEHGTIGRHILSFTSFALLGAILVVASSGCSGGGSSSSTGGGPTTADFTVGDAAAGGFQSFTITIDELHVVNSDGVESANLLTSPVTVEIVGLHDQQAWIARAQLPSGTLTAVKLVFDSGSVVAHGSDGSAVPITVVSNTLTAPFTNTVDASNGGNIVILVQLDLSESVTGSTAGPPIELMPHGLASTNSNIAGVPITDVRGIVQSSNPNGPSFVVDASSGQEFGAHLGATSIDLVPSTLILDINGVQTSPGPFFDSIMNQHTFVVVSGLLKSDGHIQAQSIRLQDNAGGSTVANQVMVQGLVTGVGPGSTFTMTSQNVSLGSTIANPALGTLGNTIPVQFDPQTTFSFENSLVANSAQLEIGEPVTVTFPTLASAPFIASSVGIDGEPQFTGTITGVGALPNTVTMQLDPGSPAFSSGLVSSNTDVTVHMGSSTILLDTTGQPTLQSSQLLTGLHATVSGGIAGTPQAPSIVANQLLVQSGLFEGTVVSTTPAANTFVANSSSVISPFGSNVTSSPFTVSVSPNTVFQNQSNSSNSFFTSFNTLPTNGNLNVFVKGVGSGTSNGITAFQVESASTP